MFYSVMSIQYSSRDNIVQDLSVVQENKELFGEIFTPFSLVDEMFDLLPPSVFGDPTKQWLDSGAGTGFFSMVLYWRLIEGLADCMPDSEERHRHIIRNMIFMSEIREENADKIYATFGDDCNLSFGDFLDVGMKVDFVIGNPPYNSGGIKKVPTNSEKNKTHDGKTAWLSFTKHAIGLLREGGSLLYVVPSLWMRKDRARSYDLLTSYKINKIVCMSNTLTNKYFSGEAQTPTCFFHLVKRPNDYTTSLFDRDINQFIDYKYLQGEPLPVYGSSVLSKVKRVSSMPGISFKKTNMPPKSAIIQPVHSNKTPFANVRTCILDGLDASLVVDYSDKPLSFHGQKKIIMAHKMYGFPFIDRNGEYGISNRDNYVILHDDERVLERIATFFSTKTALYLFETTRYRMKYLEKEILGLLPDVGDLISGDWCDELIWDHFALSEKEIDAVKALHSKEYTFKHVGFHAQSSATS